MLGKLDPFEIDLQGGDSTKRGWLGALLGAVAEVGEAGSSERSGEVPLNRVGSLEELSEVEHDWISFLKWPWRLRTVVQTDTEVAQALEHARERVRAGAGL